MTADPRDELSRRLTALQVPEVSAADVQAVADRKYSASDPSGEITATVDGSGTLVDLEVSVVATRGAARDELGSRVVAVVNSALTELERARASLLPGDLGDLDAKLDAITENLNARMDALLNRLDGIDRSLPEPPRPI